MQFEQYPSYKNSGVEWLGDVPEHWQVKPNKYVFKIQKRIAGTLGFNVLSITQKGLKIKDIESNAGQMAQDYSKYQIVNIGDFAMNHMDLLTGWIDIAKVKGVTSPDYRVFEVRNKKVNKEYFLHLFQLGYRNKILFAFGQGAAQMGRWRLQSETFNTLKMPFPSIEEQEKIVAFLDTETARIDNLIAKQEKLIELLEEQRKSIISHAVTKGLNPNAPMKDSGVEWLGEVPEHWKIGKLKRWFNTVSGGTPNSNNYAKYYKNGTHPWLRTTDLNNGILTSFEIGITDEAIKESSCKYVPEDSVLIAMYGGDGTIGKNALLKFKSTINQAICALIPNSHFNPEYTFFYIQFYRPYWMVNAMGGRKDPNINQQQIQDAYFVLPPFNEQNKIVDFLKKEHSRIDSLVLKQNQLIEKMKEYRASIISHAVTGKINVQEFGA